MNFKPTSEQEAIITAAKDTTDNLLVTALAGAAKTTTLVMIAEALPDTEMLCLAFNKKIALEMQERLPENCKAMTLNSLGHRTWSAAIGRRLTIDTSKTYRLLKAAIEEFDQNEKKHLYDSFSELMRTIDFGKACGYVPTDHFDRAKRLMDDDEFFDHIELKLSPLERDIIRLVTINGINEAMTGLCDFGDQIFMPTIFHGAFPLYNLVLIDEAQDLSALNHATLRKMCKRRLIAVGDSCQAIYGFRGAHEDSMSLLSQQFKMQEFQLSISFRCSQAIVEHSLWRAPQMKPSAMARPGKITTLESWTVDDIPENAVIICRNNAPLFSTGIKLLKNGRPAEIGGREVVKPLTKIMSKFGGSELTQSAVFDRIAAWEEREIAKTKDRAHGSIRDRAECMRIFAREGETLGNILAYIQHITHIHSPLKLMTGHKSKGLEFKDVFFLDEDLVRDEGQDRNLRYVIITRSQDTLTYINTNDFCDNE